MVATRSNRSASRSRSSTSPARVPRTGTRCGDDAVRFCRHCSLHVYNLSAMTREAAERLVAGREGRVCVRMYRRADGTVITADCGGGWKLAARRQGGSRTAMAVTLSAVLAPLGLWRGAGVTDRFEQRERPARRRAAAGGGGAKASRAGRVDAGRHSRAVGDGPHPRSRWR